MEYGAADANSDISHKIFASVFIPIPCCTLSSLDRSRKGLVTRAVLFSLVQTMIHRRIALWALAVLSGSTDPSYNMLRGDLVSVSNLKDSLCSNLANSNSVEWTIDSVMVRSEYEEVLQIELTASLSLELSRKYTFSEIH